MANLPELKTRWLAQCKHNGFPKKAAIAEWTYLTNAYQRPERAYHNLDHIEHCLRLLDENCGLVIDANAVEFALWFHDIIYDPKRSDNERESAAVAKRFLNQDHQLANEVSALIIITEHRDEPTSQDMEAILDFDLAVLGEPAETYDNYAAKIRQEFSHIEEDAYRQGRTAVLQHFLQRERIYYNRSFQTEREAPARKNLKREIDQLAAN